MTINMKIASTLLATLGLFACGQGEQAAAPAEPAEVQLETTEQRISYGIAFGLGKRLGGDGIPVDVAAFSAGIADGFNGDPARLSEQEISQELQAFQQQQNAVREEQASAEATANQAAGEAFLAANAEREGVVVLESGLQYLVLESGSGELPGPTDMVEVHYRGTLIDGTEFDSSYSRGQTVTFGVNQVIAGWTEALQLMPVGSKWQLFIPSNLAYGAGGTGPIGPNSTLLFDVELIAINP